MIALPIIVRDAARVGDHHVRHPRRQPLRDPIPGFRRPRSISCDSAPGHPHSAPTGMPSRRGIQVNTALAALQYSTASCLRPRSVSGEMQRRKKSVRDGVEIFVPDGGQVLEPHAAIVRLAYALPAIDGQGVAARRPDGWKVLRRKFRIRRSGRECRACRGSQTARAGPETRFIRARRGSWRERAPWAGAPAG